MLKNLTSCKEKSIWDNKRIWFRSCHLISDVRLDEKKVKDIHW